MRGYKPEGEISGTIDQKEIGGNGVHSWFPGFLRVRKFSVQVLTTIWEVMIR